MAFDDMRRRQQAIQRRNNRKGRKFSLLLSQITVPSPHYSNPDSSSSSTSRYGGRNNNGNSSRLRYVVLSFAPILLILWLFLGRASQEQQALLTQTYDRGTVRNKYWRANVIEQIDDSGKTTVTGDRNELLSKLSSNGSSRPFNFIGDLDPAEPQPWPTDEKDWWSLHKALVKNVRESDASSPLPFDINADSRLPQLVFYGDSITEGWRGTTFGNVPGKHRMWTPNEHTEIQSLFSNTFGEESQWGQRALKPPLVLGISGSRTYDLIWRIEDGEFATSRLLESSGVEKREGDRRLEEDEEEGGSEDAAVDANEDMDSVSVDEETQQSSSPNENNMDNDAFQLENLERIYIVLMGTNNIGGGMLPTPTLNGMDATGRAILKLHSQNFPKSTPAAILFSELLPRHDDFRAERMCPPRCANLTALEPYKSFMPAIEKVNRGLPEVVEGWRRDYPNSRIILLSSAVDDEDNSVNQNTATDETNGGEIAANEKDEANTLGYQKTINCGRHMFAIDDMDEYDTYMPDRLHPNMKGYELWSHCLKKGLEVVMDGAIHLTTVNKEVEEEEDE